MAKYCVNCGAQMEDDQAFCASCGTKQDGTNQATDTTQQATVTNTNPEAKSKIAAGLLGIFLGAFGVHNFYLGYTGKAVAQLLITILTCGLGAFISGTWGLIEGILILVGNINKDANGVQLAD